MRLHEYGRNPSKRKEYVHHPDLLLVGVDVSKAKHHACMGTQPTMSCRTFAFPHTREGFQRFAQTLRNHLVQTRCQRLLIAMAPSGLSWQALYERLQDCGYEVCLVHGPAVRNNRRTMQEGTRKTDAIDAYRVFDLLRQGTFFLPGARDPPLRAAYRFMPRHMALKKRGSHLRNPLRAAMHLAFPEVHPVSKDLTQPTSLRCLQVHPTPESVLRHGRRHFLDQWQPRRRWGQWHREQWERISDWATASIGLKEPYGMDEFAIKALAHDLADALTTQHLWLTPALEFLAPRQDCQLLQQLPRIGQPPAAAILTAIGEVGEYSHGKP
jgi:hypothetical protein